MAASTFFIPSVNVIGADSLNDAMNMMAEYGFRRTLIVTDSMLTQLGMAGDVQKALQERDIFSVIYDGTQPNPTTENVAAGLKLLTENNCDSVISLGGGSPHDCAKGIALVAANGGDIRDYEGVDRSAKPQLPMIAINTTAGTASEMTRFCIITDEARHIKMAIVDKHFYIFHRLFCLRTGITWPNQIARKIRTYLTAQINGIACPHRLTQVIVQCLIRVSFFGVEHPNTCMCWHSIYPY